LSGPEDAARLDHMPVAVDDVRRPAGVDGCRGHGRRAARPPSIGMIVPEMYAAPGEQRNATVSATSAPVPSRRIGALRVTMSMIFCGSPVLSAIFMNSPVSVADGEITCTRTPSGACSIAACFARLLSAPFDAQYAA